VFVHMGATFSKEEELDVIKTGRIHYRDVDIKDVSVRFIGNTAIVLSTLQLGSVVDGNEVSNPFVVTEVYVQQAEGWTLASMSFTRLVTSL
jgi:ketosteroid isomerase-like protein